MTWLGILILVAAPPLCIFGLQMVCAPRSTSAVLARGLNAVHRKTMEAGWAKIPVGTQGLWPSARQPDGYEKLCRKYADTLPAFSGETRRIMQREGHLPTPQRITWDDLPHYGPKAPGLMRVWPNGYPPTTAGFQGSDTLRNSPYAPRIVCEVVEVEEIEIMSKGSAEVKVEGFERRYYQPIEEPDISRILLDES